MSFAQKRNKILQSKLRSIKQEVQEAKDIIERKQKYNEEQRKRKTNGSNDG